MDEDQVENRGGPSRNNFNNTTLVKTPQSIARSQGQMDVSLKGVTEKS